MFQKIGHTIKQLESCASTNAYLLDWIANETVNEGTIVLAKEQFKGRGMAGDWVTSPGENLTFSFVIYPRNIGVDSQFRITQFCSLAVNYFLSAFLPKSTFSIKWPNDILLENQKICGMLIENQVKGKQISQSVIGIGLNVNQLSFPTYDRKPTSMQLASGKRFELLDVLEELLKYLNQFYSWVEMGKLDLLNEKYLSALYLKDTWQDFQINGNKRRLQIQNVNAIGQIQVMDELGNLSFYSTKEITFLK